MLWGWRAMRRHSALRRVAKGIRPMGLLLVDVMSPLGVIGITTSRTTCVVTPCGETGGEP